MRTHSVPDLIQKKRDGQELTEDEIKFFISGLMNGVAEPAQLGSWLMAVFLKGMSLAETISLTRAMLQSGEILSYPAEWKGLVADKHSTGGVGDKISIPLAPALAACGLKVPMISGRGLGHTGGTLDKLESIPGFDVFKSTADMRRIMGEIGCCMVGQTETLVPADRLMYATRDITGTVESRPLISASIVSKKAAESLDALVLDVKVGRGAVMKTVEDSRSLASWLVGISKGLGIATRAVLTDMNNPLGLMIGNSLEVKESIYCMKGAGPHSVRMLTQVLGGHLLHILGKANSASAGAEAIGAVLDNGEALKIFRELMVQHGVDPNVATAICETPDNGILPKSKYTTPLRVKVDGHVAALDALECAHVSCSLGAGRRRAGDPVNHGVGLQLHMEVGDKMSAGDTWVTVHHDESELDESLVQQLEAALTLSAEPVTVRPLVIEVIE